MQISIIVPIYHGKVYIQRLIEIAENCKRSLGNMADVELVLSNDAPGDELEDCFSDVISIKVLNTSVNRGMQGARIVGIEQCLGEYILMLDQDDLITEDCLKSQLENVLAKNGDASICKAISEKKPVYDSQFPFEKINNLEYALEVGPCIISPGQVLLKKNAISEVWKKNILEHRGADDWLLWICMLAEGKSFVLNDEVLYEHVEDGTNASWNTVKMMASDDEILQILKKENVLSKEQYDIFEKSVKQAETKRIQILDKFRKMFFVYDEWLRLSRRGETISDFLQSKGIYNVCVYGVGYLGKALIEDLKCTDGNVICAFDRNAEYIEDVGVPVYNRVQYMENAEILIVTLVDNVDELCRNWADIMGIPVITFSDLLNDMRQI